MSEQKKVPEGMKRYSILGLNFVAPDGLPDEMLALVAEGMVESGHAVFDPTTNQLRANPDIEQNRVHGMVIKVNDDGEILSSKKIPDDEIKKDLGIKDLTIRKGDYPDLRKKK
jgi:hypothetical protein